LYGHKPEANELNTAKWIKTENHINDNFYNIDLSRYDLKSVLDKAAELIKRKGVKCIVLDPYNKIKLKGGSQQINDYTKKSMMYLFC
jgi:twinkle protein